MKKRKRGLKAWFNRGGAKGFCLLIFIVLVIILISNTVYAISNAILSDNFESYSVGDSPPSGWTSFIAGKGNASVSDTIVGEGSKSLFFNASEDDANYYDFSSQPSDLNVSFMVYSTDNSSRSLTIRLANGGLGDANMGPGITMHEDYIKTYDGTWNNIATYNTTTWYNITLNISMTSNTFNIIINDVEYGPYNFWNNQSSLDIIYLRSDAGTVDSYFDNLKITALGPARITFSEHRWNKTASASTSLDDGMFQDLIAEMFMKKYNLRGTIFAVHNRTITYYEGSGLTYLGYSWMNETQLKDVYDSGTFDVSCHTYNHDDGSEVTQTEYNQSIQNNKNWLETNITSGSIITGFAYPFGDITHNVILPLTYLYGRITSTWNDDYPFSNKKLLSVTSFRVTTATLATVKSRIDTAVNSNDWFRYYDHSGNGGGAANGIDEENRWEGAFVSLLDYLNNQTDIYHGSYDDVIEYQILQSSMNYTDLNCNTTTDILTFNITTILPGNVSTLQMKTPVTVIITLYDENCNITINDNLNVTIDNNRTDVKIINATSKSFWFEVEVGNHSISVSESSTSQLIDITKPVISSTSSDGSIITWTTDDLSDSIVYYTTNSSLNMSKWKILDRNTTKTTNHTVAIPVHEYANSSANISDSIYYVVASTNEKYLSGWDDNSGTYHNVDRTNPTLTFSCSPTSATVGETITCSCSATDAIDSNPTISYTANPPTSSTGTFTTTCTATDDAGNSASSSISYTVSSSGGGGLPTSNPTQENLKEGYEKTLRKGWKISFEFNNKTHTIKMNKIIDDKTIELTISSEPITFNLSLSEIKKVNLDNDSYYDLKIFLKDIRGTYADLVVKLISEKIPEEASEEEKVVKSIPKEKNAFLIIFYLLTGIIILGLIFVLYLIIKKKKLIINFSIKLKNIRERRRKKREEKRKR